MARISNRGRALISSIGALAVGATLFGVPAAAGTGDGRFFVHSQNATASARTFDGYAPRIPKVGTPSGDSGSGSSPSPTGGATSSPGPSQGADPVIVDPLPSTPPAVSLATFKCGPMSLDLTDRIVDQDSANRALLSAGKASEMSATNGWKVAFSSKTEYPSKLTLGIPTDPADRSKLTDLYLSPTTTISGVGSQAWMDPANAVAFVQNYSDACKVYDLRQSPKAGSTFGYQWSKNSSGYQGSTESRYLEEDGKLQPVRVYNVIGGTGLYVTRSQSPTSFLKASNSDVYPALLTTSYSSGGKSLTMAFTKTTDSYDALNASYSTDGSGAVIFTNWDRTSNEYGSPVGATVAPRKTGPTRIFWDKTGAFTQLSYAKGTNNSLALTAPFTVAHYNEVTGQNWDGSYPELSDFDTTIPFRPTIGR